MDATEKKKHAFLEAINTVRNEKISKKRVKNAQRRVERAKEGAKKEERMAAVQKANKKRQYRSEGKMAGARDRKKSRGE